MYVMHDPTNFNKQQKINISCLKINFHANSINKKRIHCDIMQILTPIIEANVCKR